MIPSSRGGLAALSLGILVLLGEGSGRAQGPTDGVDLPPAAPGSPAPVAPVPAAAPVPGPYYTGPSAYVPDAGAADVPLMPRREDAGPVGPAPLLDNASNDRGGGLGSPFMSPLVGRAPYRADYRVTWFTPQPVSGQPTDLGYERQDLSVTFPCWQNGKCDEWSALVGVRNELFQTHAILPDTHQPFPEELWNVRFGTTYRHLFDNGWIAGGTVTVGSASDKPFRSIDEMTAGVSAFLRVPSGEHNAWLFSLSYSPTSDLPIPLPMVAYVWQPNECFRANIGLPLAIWWRPTEDLTVDLSYMLLTTVRARATYRVCQPLRLYVAYASENEGYFLADRPDANDRFYDQDQRVTGGAVLALGRNASVDLSSGYVFDHHFFEGRNITSGTSFNRINVGAGPFVALQCQFRW